jgi:hypothetical protein
MKHKKQQRKMKNNEHNNEKTLKINEKCRKNNEQKQ